MADAIVRLLTDADLRREMGVAGLAAARERFSVERMVLDTLRVYQRVALHPHQEEDLSAEPRQTPRGSPSGQSDTRQT
jgi:hypothetical protein